jgi:glycogen debranching enzyme
MIMPTDTDTKRSPVWLKSTYEAKQQRSLSLVGTAIKRLVAAGKDVSIASIIAISREVDEDGRGVSRNAVLDNEQCRALYERHRTWKPSRPGRRVSKAAVSTAASKRFDRMNKHELIERISILEREKATLEQVNTTLAAENLKLRLQARQK